MAEKEKSNIYDSAGVFSRMFLWWIFPLISKGRKRFLTEEDLLEISRYHTSEYLGDKLQKKWNRELQKKNSNILKAVLRFLGWKFSIVILYVFIQDIVVIAGQSYLLGLIIHCFDNRLEWNEYNIYVLLVGFFAVTAVYMFTFDANVFMSEIYGMKIKVAFCTLIYRKAIRLSLSSLEKSNVGQMVNLLANDVSKFLSTLYGMPYLVTNPFLIITTIAILWQYYGWTILVGYSAIFFFIPIQLGLGKLYSKLRLQAAILGDERLKLLNEMIADMRLIKMYTWELPYSALLKKIRMKEMKKVRMFLYANSMMTMLSYPISKLFTSLAYLAFFFNGGQLNAEIVFVTMSVSLYIFVSTLTMFSLAINRFAEILVSLKRLQAFLLLQEKDNNASKIEEERERLTECGIWMDNVTAVWKKEPTLNAISLNVQPGELLTVIGPVGSGKTSLLMSILGEIPISSGKVTVKGKIAYASQEAWVFNETIRENILFGEEYQEEKYKNVLRMTTLEKDISLFPKGDLTIVGERGVIMSGGQKARINLARALYVDADIFLLDDPLSAVDVPVGKHIFEKCIMEYLKEKICILVTHQVQVLNSASKVLVLCKAKCEYIGNYNEMENVKTVIGISSEEGVAENSMELETALFNDDELIENTEADVSVNTENSNNINSEDEDNKIQPDDEEVGKAGLSIYKEYFNAGKGFFFKTVLLVILIMNSVKRVLNYTKLKSEASYESSLDKQPPSDWPQKGEIHFDNVFLQYSKDRNTVLKNLTFRIYSGEKIGIVGRTGAGKSSIIASLFRMTEPTGTITIDGVDIKDIGLRDLRSKISIIPQDPMLFTGPLRRNIDPFNEYSEENLWHAIEEVQLKEVISKLPGGLDTHLSEGGRNFSVGERQLICLARTILRQNKILVMDEATSNIDKSTDSCIQKIIREKFKSCTVLTIAHRLHTIIDSDKVLVLDTGKLQEFDTPYALLTNENGTFYNLVKNTGVTSMNELYKIAKNKYYFKEFTERTKL
ncbi:ATP-binding cassette sub-family C member 4-like [Centruroides vittatus]|uniref:ATP-binding cassette sub-family C member 4-like n=1 Tax=Centruroides vittatus TaxID=120091 RepID=UPI00350FF410